MRTRPAWMLPPIDELTEFPASDIARHLGNLCRYAGGTPQHYSVARHSLLVMHLLPAQNPGLRLLGLLHDVHECWIGDLLRPAKARVKLAIDDLEREYDMKIRRLIGLADYVPETYAKAVAEADSLACQIEMEWIGRETDWNDFPHSFDCAMTLAGMGYASVDSGAWLFAYRNQLRRACTEPNATDMALLKLD